VIRNGVGNLCDSKGHAEKYSRDKPSYDVENDEWDAGNVEIPTNLAMKVYCSTDNYGQISLINRRTEECNAVSSKNMQRSLKSTDWV